MNEVAGIPSPQPAVIIPLVKNIKAIRWFDNRYYEALTLDNRSLMLPSVTTIQDESIRDKGTEMFRERVGSVEANRVLNEKGLEGDHIHHAASIVDEGGLVMFEHPADKNPDPELKESNMLLRRQADAHGVKHVTLYDQREMQCVNRWSAWCDVMNVRWEMSEYVVWSLEYRYAGRADRLGWFEAGDYKFEPTIPGKRAVVVTIPVTGLYIVDIKSGAEKRKHLSQTAAYRFAHMECQPSQEVKGTIVVYLDAAITSGLDGTKTIVRVGDEAYDDFTAFREILTVWKRNHPNDEPEMRLFTPVIYKPRPMTLPHGFIMPNEKASDELLMAVNKIVPQVSIAKEPEVAKPVAEPEVPKAEEKKEPKQAVVPDAPKVDQIDWIAQIRQEVITLFPNKTDKGATARNQMVQRAFGNETMLFEDLDKVSQGKAEEAYPQIQKDVAFVLEDRKKKAAAKS
jgi:hypothetical protein